MALLPESAHTAVLEKLCADLAGALEQLDGDIEDHIPSIMQSLSSIGRIAPEIFAEHAKIVADFVLDVRSLLTHTFFILSRHPLCHDTAGTRRCFLCLVRFECCEPLWGSVLTMQLFHRMFKGCHVPCRCCCLRTG